MSWCVRGLEGQLRLQPFREGPRLRAGLWGDRSSPTLTLTRRPPTSQSLYSLCCRRGSQGPPSTVLAKDLSVTEVNAIVITLPSSQACVCSWCHYLGLLRYVLEQGHGPVPVHDLLGAGPHSR